MYSIYSKSESTFVAKCPIKRPEQFNKKLFNHYLKNQNNLFCPIKSVCFIHTVIREGEPSHLNISAYILYLHSLYLRVFFFYDITEIA